MNLFELVDNSKTDKNTLHSYLGTYQELFQKKQFTAQNILEIGIRDGGSVKLWYDYFTNATIWGLDIIPIKDMWSKIKNIPRIKLGRFDAYDEKFFNDHLANKKFDILIDDGPHTLESMLQFIKLYSTVMSDDGILVIEDVQSIEWINKLKEQVPYHLQEYIKVFDLTQNKNRYDDILFVIDKSL